MLLDKTPILHPASAASQGKSEIETRPKFQCESQQVVVLAPISHLDSIDNKV